MRLIIRNINSVHNFNPHFYLNIDGLTLFGLCFPAPYNIPIQNWRHAVISRLSICYLSALGFDCWCIFWMKICYLLRYLSCHHDASRHNTCLSWVLPCITFWVGNIFCTSVNICKDDIHDMWPVHILLLVLTLIWRTLTCKFERASATARQHLPSLLQRGS